MTKKGLDEMRHSLSDLTAVVNDMVTIVKIVSNADQEVHTMFTGGLRGGESSRPPFVHIYSSPSSSEDEDANQQYEGVYRQHGELEHDFNHWEADPMQRKGIYHCRGTYGRGVDV